jgi:hypothetical protein
MVYVALMIVALFIAGTGFSLIIDGVRPRPRRPDRTERLRPFQPSVAEEAEVWLRQH